MRAWPPESSTTGWRGRTWPPWRSSACSRRTWTFWAPRSSGRSTACRSWAALQRVDLPAARSVGQDLLRRFEPREPTRERQRRVRTAADRVALRPKRWSLASSGATRVRSRSSTVRQFGGSVGDGLTSGGTCVSCDDAVRTHSAVLAMPPALSNLRSIRGRSWNRGGAGCARGAPRVRPVSRPRRRCRGHAPGGQPPHTRGGTTKDTPRGRTFDPAGAQGRGRALSCRSTPVQRRART